MKPKRNSKGQFVSTGKSGSRATIGRTYAAKPAWVTFKTADGVVRFRAHKAVGKKSRAGKKRIGVLTYEGSWPVPKKAKAPAKRKAKSKSKRGNASMLGDYGFWAF